MNRFCPKCNSPLQENAQFCPHCMTSFAKRQEIEKPKRKISRKTLIALAVAFAVVIAAGTAGIILTKNGGKSAEPSGSAAEQKTAQRVCTVEAFKEALPLTSEKAGANDYWKPDGLIDIRIFKNENIVQYTTETYLNGGFFSVLFYNEGEEVYAYFSDIQQSDFQKAETIMKCVVRSACNNYFTDLDDIFDNEKLYPKETLDKPFRNGFTDLLKLTDRYNKEIEDGAQFTTRYIGMTDNEFTVTYTVTERVYSDGVFYDLGVEVERA